MGHIGIALYLLLTLAISFLNAFWVGSVWLEKQVMGWAGKLLVYSVAVMSLCGFLWFNVICQTFLVEAARAHHLHGKYVDWVYNLPPHYPDYIYSLGYLLIILPIIGTGIVMTVWSWVALSRQRSWRNGVGAFWNTGATMYNIWNSVQVIPQAVSNVGNLFSGSGSSGSSSNGSRSNKNGAALIIVVLVLVALVLAIVEVVFIIKWSAKWHARRMTSKLEAYANDPAHGTRATAGPTDSTW
jgi:hypothetical protein